MFLANYLSDHKLYSQKLHTQPSHLKFWFPKWLCLYYNSVHPPPPPPPRGGGGGGGGAPPPPPRPTFCWGVGLSLLQNFQKGRGAWQDLNFQRGTLGKKGWLFSGGCSFYIKNKLKSEIYNKKKFINKNVHFCHNFSYF